MLNDVRTYENGGVTYYDLSDVCRLLGLSNPTVVSKSIPDSMKGFTLKRGHKCNTLTYEGLLYLIGTSRKPSAIELATELGVTVVASSKEQDCIGIISAAFSELRQCQQYSVGNFRIDLYFPDVNLAVECDEFGHSDRDALYENFRQGIIEERLHCKFIRFNPDAPGFNIGTVIYQIRGEL